MWINIYELRIGYRKAKEDESKETVWIVPKFVINSSTSTFKDIIWSESSQIGIFWTNGNDNLNWYDYSVSSTSEVISSRDLYENWRASSNYKHGPLPHRDEMRDPFWEYLVGQPRREEECSPRFRTIYKCFSVVFSDLSYVLK